MTTAVLTPNLSTLPAEDYQHWAKESKQDRLLSQQHFQQLDCKQHRLGLGDGPTSGPDETFGQLLLLWVKLEAWKLLCYLG